MNIDIVEGTSKFYEFRLIIDNKVIGRGFLFLITNKLHKEPYALIPESLMEDIFVLKEEQRKGYGTAIVKEIIRKAKEVGCYKIVATTRYEKEKVVDMYKELGFIKHGTELRINLST